MPYPLGAPPLAAWGAGSAPIFDRVLGHPISRGREIQKRLPRARRHGLLVVELDARPPALRAPISGHFY